MKRTRIGILALCLAVLLAGCAPQQTAQPAAQAPQVVEGQAQPELQVGHLYHVQWGDMTAGSNSGTAYYETATLMQTTDPATGSIEYARTILRTDYATGVQSPLCSVPGCAHTDASCSAFVTGSVGVTAIGDNVYLMHSVTSVQAMFSDDPPQAWIEVMDTDGTGRRRLTEFPSGWEIYYENLMYTDGAALYGSYFDWDNGRCVDSGIVRVDLSTGEYQTFYIGNDYVVGTSGACFLMKRGTGEQSAYRVPFVAENEAYLYDEVAVPSQELLLYDPAAGTRQIVPDSNGVLSDLWLYSGFWQDGIFYSVNPEYGAESPTLWTIGYADALHDEQGTLTMFQSSSSWDSLMINALWLQAPSVSAREPYLRADLYSNTDGISRMTTYLIDRETGQAQEIRRSLTDWYGGEISAVPLAQTNDGRWLVPIDTIGDENSVRYAYALAAPETVFSGQGELQPIQMWAQPEPVG